MPGSDRPGWQQLTLAVSDEIAAEIQRLARDQGLDPGAAVDAALRAHLRRLQALEQLFAREVHDLLKATRDPEGFLELLKAELPGHLHSSLTLEPFRTVATRWFFDGHVPPPWKAALFRAMQAQREWPGLPRLFEEGVVDEAWFETFRYVFEP